MPTKLQDTSWMLTSDNAAKSGQGMEPIKKKRLDFSIADGLAAATSDTKDLAFQLPAGSILHHVSYKIRQLATDGVVTVASATLELGDGADADRFLAAVDVLTGSGTLGFAVADPTDPDGAAGTDVYPQALSAATTIRATLTADVNLDTLTEFSATIWVDYMVPEDPEG